MPPVPLLLLDIGLVELLVLAGLAVVLFGGDLPDALRRAGRVVARLRLAAAELAQAADPTQPESSAPKPTDDGPVDPDGNEPTEAPRAPATPDRLPPPD